jgi:hypothetical protein
VTVLPLDTSAAAMRQSPRANDGPSDRVSGRCSASGDATPGSEALSRDSVLTPGDDGRL